MIFKVLKYAVILSLLPPVAFAQLVKKDATAERNYFNEDGTMRIAIAKQLQRPSSGGGKNALDGPDVMANGGIQDLLKDMNATVRVSNAQSGPTTADGEQSVHSLVDQSLHSRLGATTTNGDGFGIGWFDAGDTPGVFHANGTIWMTSQ